MVAKGFKDMLAEANATIDTASVEDAVAQHGSGDAIFVDVREDKEWGQGHVAGAVHAPRGFLEFMADPESPMHVAELASGRKLIVYCASGGRSALASKTLQEMGVAKVVNMAGGFNAWKEAGGPVDG